MKSKRPTSMLFFGPSKLPFLFTKCGGFILLSSNCEPHSVVGLLAQKRRVAIQQSAATIFLLLHLSEFTMILLISKFTHCHYEAFFSEYMKLTQFEMHVSPKALIGLLRSGVQDQVKCVQMHSNSSASLSLLAVSQTVISQLCYCCLCGQITRLPDSLRK